MTNNYYINFCGKCSGDLKLDGVDAHGVQQAVLEIEDKVAQHHQKHLEVELAAAGLGQRQEQERDERNDEENKAKDGEVQEPHTVELVHGAIQEIKQITLHFCDIYTLNIILVGCVFLLICEFN